MIDSCSLLHESYINYPPFFFSLIGLRWLFPIFRFDYKLYNKDLDFNFNPLFPLLYLLDRSGGC